MTYNYNKHHIIPRSKYGSNHSDNIIKLDIRKHNALHMLFDNKLPHEQLERILDLASTVLSNDVKSDLIEIISNKDYSYWYKKHTYKR